MADMIIGASLMRTPLVDVKTGYIAREWYLFFLTLWNRTGGGSDGEDSANQNIVLNQGQLEQQILGLIQDLGSGPPVAPVVTLDDQAPPDSPVPDVDPLEQVFALQSQVRELEREIQALKQAVLT